MAYIYTSYIYRRKRSTASRIEFAILSRIHHRYIDEACRTPECASRRARHGPARTHAAKPLLTAYSSLGARTPWDPIAHGPKKVAISETAPLAPGWRHGTEPMALVPASGVCKRMPSVVCTEVKESARGGRLDRPSQEASQVCEQGSCALIDRVRCSGAGGARNERA